MTFASLRVHMHVAGYVQHVVGSVALLRSCRPLALMTLEMPVWKPSSRKKHLMFSSPPEDR